MNITTARFTKYFEIFQPIIGRIAIDMEQTYIVNGSAGATDSIFFECFIKLGTSENNSGYLFMARDMEFSIMNLGSLIYSFTIGLCIVGSTFTAIALLTLRETIIEF